MAERDYVLGTERDEIERLGLQHRVWRPRMLDSWSRAGLSEGQVAIDVGAGPGYATLDLAEIVGPAGQVIAVERSGRFLETLGERAQSRALSNIEVKECDVVEQGFGESVADFAWCRWLLCFVVKPRAALLNIVRALKPGGVAVFHEYADYGAWQMMPPNPDHDRFRSLVMQSWRDSGGEPDIGLYLPTWLAEEGMDLIDVRPHSFIVDSPTICGGGRPPSSRSTQRGFTSLAMPRPRKRSGSRICWTVPARKRASSLRW